MSDDTPAASGDKLAERLNRMKPTDAKPRRRGINPYALSAATAVAGAAFGAWLVLSAPDAPDPGLPMETGSVSGFQGEGGTDGFTITKPGEPVPQVAPTVVRDETEEERLRGEIDILKAEIEALKANPVTVTDDAALADLQARLAAIEAEAKAKAEALSELERENIRLQTELDTRSLIEGDPEAERQRAREEELARRRAEAEALREAQINSEMVALRGADGRIPAGGEDAAGLSGERYIGDEAFVRAGAKAAEARQASIIANPAHTVVQGTLIEAALETAINTQLAGNVSAVVSHDVWSFDMSRVLIPRGSKLYGRYASDVAAGQRRVLIAWDRIVTTDGQSVSLAAYGTDRIGRSGLPGKVRTHFLQRFGTAALISVIGAVPTLAAAKYADDEVASETAENVGTDLGNAVNEVMADYLSIPPTISVDQGAVVMIRVDADLEFY